MTDTKALLKNLSMEHLHEIKESYMKQLASIQKEEVFKEIDERDTVTLYHGTSTVHLQSILSKGILPRKDTGNDNWSHVTSSIENVTYMTNKWHYFYGVNASMEYISSLGDEQSMAEKVIEHNVFPCYVECKVPRALLVFDEDAILSKFMFQKVKKALKQQTNIAYDPMECLAQYGTVGVIGSILPEYIQSFTVLGEPDMYKYVIDHSSIYYKDWLKWQKGNGKGQLKLKELLQREAQSDLNGTWWVKDIPKGAYIERFGINPKTNKLAIHLGRM